MNSEDEGFGGDEPTPAPRARQIHPGPNGVPYSRAAEEYVLSACFLDGSDAVGKCIAAHLSPLSFHLPAHQVVFEKCLNLYKQNRVIDLALVAEELKTSRQLEQIGGYAFLTEISDKLPTTAQAPEFIAKVREMETLRDLQRLGRQAVESVESYTGEMSELLGALRARLDTIENGRRSNALTQRIYAHARQIPKPEPIFTLDGTTICTPGNLTTLLSQAKAGKSAVVGAMLAAAIKQTETDADTFGIACRNYEGKCLLHLDTEQSPYDWQQMIRTALRRAGVDQPPPWLMSLTLTGLPAKECRYMLGAAVREAKRRHGGIFAVIVDGTADMVVDPNDPGECFPLVAELHDLAIRHETAVVNVLHMNPGKDQEKARGHLGSQLERKSESNLMLHKDESGVTEIWGTKQRGKMILRKEAHCFTWSDKEGMHLSVDREVKEKPSRTGQPGRPSVYEFPAFRKIFPQHGEKPLPISQLIRKAQDIILPGGNSIKKDTFRAKVYEWLTAGYLIEIQGINAPTYTLSHFASSAPRGETATEPGAFDEPEFS